MPASFTLYGNAISAASNRVSLMLAEAGFTDYDFVSLNFRTAEQKVGSTLLSSLLGLQSIPDLWIYVQTLHCFKIRLTSFESLSPNCFYLLS